MLQEQLRASAALAQAESAALLAQAEAAGAAALAAQMRQDAATAAARTAAAAAAAPEPEPAAAVMTIAQFLDTAKLTKYADAIEAAEYVELDDLLDADEADLKKLAEAVQMATPAAKRLLKMVHNHKTASGGLGGGGSPAAAAAEPEPEPETIESHEQMVPQDQTAEMFDLVFSNKTNCDPLCLEIRAALVAKAVRVWQQKTNIPKDSDNW